MKRLVYASLALALVAGCGGDGAEPSATTTPTATQARPASTASIRIVHPEDGATVRGTTLTVRVELTGGRILEEASRDIRPDTGHVHLELDDRVVTLLAGLTYEITGLAAGGHVLEAEFAAADHGSFNPPVVDVVTFTAA